MSTKPKKPEIFIGLVGALGANLERVTEIIEERLKAFDYDPEPIRLAQAFSQIREKWKELPSWPFDDYVGHHQTAGSDFRKDWKSGDAVAQLAIWLIRNRRKDRQSEDISRPAAFIIRQLKRPDEVELLRQVYGNSFYLVAAYRPRELRVERVSLRIATSHDSMLPHDFRDRAEHLIKVDEKETNDPLGQNVRDAFPKADVFLNTANEEELEQSITRFLDLLFGAPFITPHPDEFAMFHAKAAALRSSDPDLQVGAVVASTNGGDIVAVGTNEVPKAGGGLYWEGDPGDARDFHQGVPDTSELKQTLLGELLTLLRNNGWLTNKKKKLDHDELLRQAIPLVKGTRAMSVSEFGRTVHAEMAALLDAARRGVSVMGNTLYTTAFPCQNCTRHIVAVGVMRVLYIDPYPKSLASLLHRDSIVIEGTEPSPTKVSLQPYCGIAPRLYMDFFVMSKRRTEDGRFLSWSRQDAYPRRVADASIYLRLEGQKAEKFRRRRVSILAKDQRTDDLN